MKAVDDVRIIQIVRTYVRAYAAYKWQFSGIAALAIASSVIEGIGISAIIPLFSFIGGGGGAIPTDSISTFIASLFAFFGITFTFRFLLVFVAVLFVARIVVLNAIQFATAWVGYGFERDTRNALFSQTVKADWPYLSRQKVGNLEQLLTTNSSQAAQIIYALETALIVGTKSIMYVALAIIVSGWVGVISLAVGCLAFFLLRPLLYRTRLIASSIERINRALSHFAAEHTIGMKAVKSMALENPVAQKARGYFEQSRRLHLDIALFRSLVQMGIQLSGVAFIAILFVVMYRTPGFSIASFAVIVYAINQIFNQVQMGQSQLHIIGIMSPYLTQVLHYIDESKRAEERESAGKAFSFEKEIELRNVKFAYPERDAAITGVSFTIRRGELVGIIGPSGAGKTTVADLLLRLVDPSDGAIFADGIDSHDISKKEWRTHVGYVAQDAVLLNDTIEANIRFYSDAISEEDVKAAARLAHIHDFVETLPGGYQAVVGDRGVFLSGGQRQRIALARVLARKPALLVLDEATSSLDTESEREIQSAVEQLRGGTAVVIIAHRMTTVANVDSLVVLKAGTVVEVGSPEQLLAKKDSYFARMMRSHPADES